MLARHVALVSQTEQVALKQLVVAAAAIQKQITRDFGPIWGIDADVAAFGDLADVPLGYWPIILRDDTPAEGAEGIHLNKRNGQPFALIRLSDNWTLTTSHECLEMLADPSGNRTQAGDSVKSGQGRVEYLVEVCDPCEAPDFAYSVNRVLVSDFYTPNFFDPVAAPGVRYSFTGEIKKPHQVLDGGYLSWIDPEDGHLWQQFVGGDDPGFKNRAPVTEGMRTLKGVDTLRSLSDWHSEPHRKKAMTKQPMREGLIPSCEMDRRGGIPVPHRGRAHKTHADALQEALAALPPHPRFDESFNP